MRNAPATIGEILIKREEIVEANNMHVLIVGIEMFRIKPLDHFYIFYIV